MDRLNHSQRHLVKVLAVLLVGQVSEEAIVARESAAVLHGIPLIGSLPNQVQFARPSRSGGRSSVTCRTLPVPANHESIFLEGVRLSTPAQTLVDLGRRRPLASNLAGIDHALRTKTVTKDEIRKLAAVHPRAPGKARLLAAVEAASALAESPGESLSRAVMLERHLPIPQLQSEVFSRSGEFIGRVDFMWPDLGVIGEFDGVVKYTRALSGKPVDKIVIEERRRENRLERVTGMRVVRWTWNDAIHSPRLLDLLADVGILPQH
ncbi:hypothetical protein [Actinomyces trachealis]|uniref:hypothetical protein n=1 Tax=Actinomyces trachealis TaxID=2763540 RepID=UPI001F43BFA6|nr:hypothetical protein [Actinomyces trachealis]